MAIVQRSSDLKASDAAAVEAGVPFLLLMEAAGRAVAEAVARDLPAGSRVVVLCGKGANGGDGLVAARWLKHRAFEVTVLARAGRGDGHPVEMWDALVAHGVTPVSADEDHLGAALAQADALVDALYGAGFRPPLDPEEAALVERVNAARAAGHLRVWAVDLPSGLASDRASVEGTSIAADRTVALTTVKPAHLFAPAADRCGQTEVASAGVPLEIVAEHASADTAEASEMRSLLPVRSRGAHKGSAGKVVVAGGLPRYPGAPALAARGALRGGAGLVTVVSLPGAGLAAPVEATRHELSAWDPGNIATIAGLAPDALAAGMGMGSAPEAVLVALLALDCPTVLDADALQPSLAGLLADRPVVLTPHPGEAARLLACPVAEVTADPLAAAARLVERFAATIVLKGGPSLVAAPGCRPWVNTTGNPGMATGGSGDVLSGLIAALLGQGLQPWDAARLGVYLHGAAGDLAALSQGYGLVASDIADHIGEAWLALANCRAGAPL